MKKKFLFFFLSIILATNCFSQNAKKFYSSGEKYQKANSYADAIENFNKCLEQDPNYAKAYISRAACYEMINKKQEAADDYKRATVFNPREKELFYNAARLFFDVKNVSESDAMLKKAIELDDEYQDAITLRLKTLSILKNFQDGLAVAELGLNIKKSAVNLYNRAVMYDSLKNYAAAEKDYKESKYYDSKFIPAYVGLAMVQLKLNKADQALASCDAALVKDANSKDIFFARSQIYAQKNDYQSALNDISKVTISDPTNIDAFFLRATYYQKLGQWQNAANDFGTCIKINNQHIDYYIGRAYSYEQINNFSAAIKDYESVQKMANTDATKQMLSKAKEKLYELNRESNKPEVFLTNPKPDNSIVKIPGNKSETILNGYVKDANFIKSITANNTIVVYGKDSLNPSFEVKLNLTAATKEIVIVATDIYDNVQKTIFSIQRTEVDKPIVALTTPYTSFDNEISLDNTNPELYIEGKVKDESIIESIVIDGVAASFPINSQDPVFSAKISIANKNKINIVVKDAYGNITDQDFKINRDGALSTQNNPMGNTWMIFIENSTYQNFPKLEGPAKDVTLMKSALVNYKVTKIVHKKDMTKTELEKFFAIELRDLARNNKINSLMIWYAGHGKFVNQTGYWIPVDAKTDDEFTYFNINNLRASMQSYTQLVHTLVITDACESGPSFYLTMRGDKERRCDNWEDTKFKSAQVLSSAGYELAADLSQFTTTFASALNNNPDGCISIEKIAEKVSSAVKLSGKQAPELKRIKGLDDQEGTFFFMKK